MITPINSSRPTQEPDFTQPLAQAIAAFRGTSSHRPQADVVVAALLQAEKFAKQQRLNYPFEALAGRWRLCLTTGVRKNRQRGGIALGKGFYMPRIIPASIAFTPTSNPPNQGHISNQIQLGSLWLGFTGPCRYADKKNILAFDFTELQFRVLGKTIFQRNLRGGKTQASEFDQRSLAQLPFFAFFWVTSDAIAARGRGGGLALWVREDESESAL